MSVKQSLWKLVPRIVIGLGVLLFIAGLMTWENMSWRAAYSSITPGMDMSAVEARFKELKPQPRRCDYSPGGFWERESYGHLIIAGPNRWKYVFYIDINNRIVDKAKWWG